MQFLFQKSRKLIVVSFIVFTIAFAVMNFILFKNLIADLEFTQKELSNLDNQQRLMNILYSIKFYKNEQFFNKNFFKPNITIEDAKKEIEYFQSFLLKDTSVHPEKFDEKIKFTILMLKELANYSNLILDPAIESYYLVNILINITPDLLANTSPSLFINHKISNHDYLFYLKEQLLYSANKINNEALSRIVNNIAKNLTNITSLNDEKDISSATYNLWQDYLNVNTFSSSLLNNILNSRYTEIKRQLLSLILSSISAYLVGVFLIIYGYKNYSRFKELEQSKLIRDIIETLIDGIITINDRGMIISFNKAAEKIFSYKASDVIGKNISMLMAPNIAVQHDQHIKNFIETGERKIIGIGRELLAMKKNGAVFPIELGVNSLNINGELIFVGSVRDISHRKDAETKLSSYTMELAHANRQLEEERAKANRANDYKSAFLAQMSHELRTPLNGIIGMTDLLLSSKLTEKQRKQASIVINSAENLLYIINNILDLSKIESGKLELEKIPFNLKELLQDLVTLMSTKKKTKNVDISFCYNDSLKECYLGDPTRIKQITTNFLGNAIKFTDTGKIKLEISEESRSQERVKLKIAVHDTGIGISKEDQQKLFNQYEQGSSSTARKYGGTGLGLSICKELAEMMDGNVGCDSVYGKGSVFWVTVLLEISEVQSLTNDKALVGNNNNGEYEMQFEGVNILLAEDNLVNREYLNEILKSLGCNVDFAENGIEAVSKAKNNNFDLIFMDVMMPEMDGFEASRQINEFVLNNNKIKTPVIALTANALAGDREKCLAAGMDDYITKPIRKPQIEETLGKWLSQNNSPLANDEEYLDLDEINNMKSVMNNKFASFVDLYIEDTKNNIHKLLNLANNNGMACNAAVLAHAIKSSSKQVGAKKVSELAEKIELNAKNLALIEANCAVLLSDIKKLEDLCKEVEPYLLQKAA